VTKQRRVFEFLQNSIQTGELAPGARLNTREIAQQTGVSQIPVREAIRALEGQGLVKILPHAGAIVTGVSVREFWEVAQLRDVLEPFGARLATMYVTPADLHYLAGLIDDMDDAIRTEDLARFMKIVRRFHQRIYDRCPNQRLRDLLLSLRGAAQRNQIVASLIPNFAMDAMPDHRALLDALAARDARAAERSMAMHREAMAARLAPHIARLAQIEADDDAPHEFAMWPIRDGLVS
jgi:DNA-binding GntR family transcriptional regulator